MNTELSVNEKRVVQIIHLVKSRLGEPLNAYVVYTRSIFDYKIPPSVNRIAYIRTHKNICDDLDQLIKDVILTEYPDAMSSSFFMDTQEDRNYLFQFFSKYKKGSFQINISPNVKIEEALKSPKVFYPAFFRELRLYYPRTEDNVLYNLEGGIIKYTLEDKDKYVNLGERLQSDIGSLEDL